MRASLALALALVGCGGGPAFEGWSTARAHVPSAEDTIARVTIAPLVVLARGTSAPYAVLGEDGALTGPGCELAVSAEGVVSDGAAVLLRVEEDGRVLDAAGEERFRLDGARLVRADGSGAATIEASEGVAEVRFEGSPALALRVEGASDEALRRTALVVVGALALCGT